MLRVPDLLGKEGPDTTTGYILRKGCDLSVCVSSQAWTENLQGHGIIPQNHKRLLVCHVLPRHSVLLCKCHALCNGVNASCNEEVATELHHAGHVGF